jgi:hypothetical protein
MNVGIGNNMTMKKYGINTKTIVADIDSTIPTIILIWH